MDERPNYMDLLGGRLPSYALPSVGNGNLANDFHKRLVKMISQFEEELDSDKEVGMRLVSFGQAIMFHVQNIGYYNPSLIRFFGTSDDGLPIELIQHVSQISFLLQAVPALDPSNPRRIGFEVPEERD